MLIRKEKISYVHIIVSRAGISLAIFGFAYMVFWLLTRQDAETLWTMPSHIDIGTSITITGTIVNDNQFPHYTHMLQTSDRTIYGINSPHINLNTYLGYGEIYGTINKKHNGLPIITVKSLKLPDQKTIIHDDNIYIFTDGLLYLDFSSQSSFVAQRTDTNSIAILFNGMPFADIHYTPCNKVNANQDCESLFQQFAYGSTENFRSFQGYNFYRKKTTEPRTAFSEDFFVYTFTPYADYEENFPATTYMFDFINKAYILNKYKEQINQRCKSIESDIFTIQSSHLDINQDILLLTMTGTINQTDQRVCTIGFDMWNNFSIITNRLQAVETVE